MTERPQEKEERWGGGGEVIKTVSLGEIEKGLRKYPQQQWFNVL